MKNLRKMLAGCHETFVPYWFLNTWKILLLGHVFNMSLLSNHKVFIPKQQKDVFKMF